MACEIFAVAARNIWFFVSICIVNISVKIIIINIKIHNKLYASLTWSYKSVIHKFFLNLFLYCYIRFVGIWHWFELRWNMYSKHKCLQKYFSLVSNGCLLNLVMVMVLRTFTKIWHVPAYFLLISYSSLGPICMLLTSAAYMDKGSHRTMSTTFFYHALFPLKIFQMDTRRLTIRFIVFWTNVMEFIY